MKAAHPAQHQMEGDITKHKNDDKGYSAAPAPAASRLPLAIQLLLLRAHLNWLFYFTIYLFLLLQGHQCHVQFLFPCGQGLSSRNGIGQQSSALEGPYKPSGQFSWWYCPSASNLGIYFTHYHSCKPQRGKILGGRKWLFISFMLTKILIAACCPIKLAIFHACLAHQSGLTTYLEFVFETLEVWSAYRILLGRESTNHKRTTKIAAGQRKSIFWQSFQAIGGSARRKRSIRILIFRYAEFPLKVNLIM